MTWRDFIDLDSIARACFRLSGELPALLVFAIIYAATDRLVPNDMFRWVLERMEEIVLIGIVLLLGVDALIPLARRVLNGLGFHFLAA